MSEGRADPAAKGYGGVVDDLEAEGAALEAVIGPLDAAAAATPTAAEGWDVRDTVAHLAGGAWLAAVAVTEPAVFADRLAGVDRPDAPRDWDGVRDRWRAERGRLVAGLRAAGPHDRHPWIAGPMSGRSFGAAQLMETWAHGVDIADAVGVPYPATFRLRHVARLGVRTRPFTFAQHGLPAPEDDVRVLLDAPGGRVLWSWGRSETEVVRGDARDFCLVVTQRRHVDDTALSVTGDVSQQWMQIAQAFAGPPTTAARGRGG
ncbi:MAG: maleylpyruvate isomerase family mycothiol-dependent enzyme [Actinobacteria bacterium]|nr:maleylpyruvate isomerase family mycothiol-dependent enzyme [Actinomycetota bacterium]